MSLVTGVCLKNPDKYQWSKVISCAAQHNIFWCHHHIIVVNINYLPIYIYRERIKT